MDVTKASATVADLVAVGSGCCGSCLSDLSVVLLNNIAETFLFFSEGGSVQGVRLVAGIWRGVYGRPCDLSFKAFSGLEELVELERVFLRFDGDVSEVRIETSYDVSVLQFG